MGIKNKKLANILLGVLFSMTIFSIGFFLGYRKVMNKIGNTDKDIIQTIKKSSLNSKENVDFTTYYEVWETVKKDYINTGVDEQEMVYGSIKGMVESLGDMYSTFLSPVEKEDYDEQSAGQFEGIGARLRFDGNYTIIETPIDGFPAQKAGLMPGDIILSVDGEDMSGKQAYYVAEQIRGEKGTEVKLEIFRESDGEKFEVVIVRDSIDLDNIEFEMIGDTDIVHLEIHRFSEDTWLKFNQQWDGVVDDIISENPEAIILDLRNNPGGYVNSAIHVLEDFLPVSSKLMMEESRAGIQNSIFSSRKGDLLEIPMVVLINEGTASASEIVAGALQDHDRSDLIGEKTVGKGVEQRIYEFNDGSALHLVFKKWLTPNGQNLSFGDSLTPDYEVELTSEDFEQQKDPQLDKAIELLSK